MKKMPYASGCAGALVCAKVAEAVNGPLTLFAPRQ